MRYIKDKELKSIRHRISTLLVLCLFGLCALFAYNTPQKKRVIREDQKVYLEHADELKRDIYGPNPDAQILKGNVRLKHNGATLTCDSAYLYQESNSVRAFGRVLFRQGDTLSLKGERGFYDGVTQILEVRKNVVLKHRNQTLYTDSLNYDRMYKNAYFFDGGKLVDGKDQLIADWGEYNTQSRQAVFYFGVKLNSGKSNIETDTLYYDAPKSQAHFKGPTTIVSNGDVVKTQDGYFDTKKDKVELFSRSTITSKEKVITGDTLYRDKKTGIGQGYGNVIYVDKKNKNELHADVFVYNEKIGKGFATKKALLKDYSQGDTLFMHADSLKIETMHINTDSAYRKVHAFRHVVAYRKDVQAICDSLVANGKDSCLTMYYDPVLWSDNRQVLGEKIYVYMNDSTIRMAKVEGQALSVEQLDDKKNFNQVSSKLMNAYFDEGALRRLVCIDNVRIIFYPINDKDSSMIGLNYIETDTMRMYINKEKKLERIWMPKAQGTLFPISQIPTDKLHLPSFAWLDHLRPKSKEDVFKWKGKTDSEKLRVIERQKAPVQRFESENKPKETTQQNTNKPTEENTSQ